MELVDTHCHIHFKDYPIDKNQAIKDAEAAGVKRLICVGTSIEDSQAAVDFAGRHGNIWASAGAHPHDGADYLQNNESAHQLRQLLGSPKAVAVGEIGLDYYHTYSSKDDQKLSFRNQVEIGLEFDKPFIFHVRDAWEDFWEIFDSYSGISGVIHSFSAHKEQLEQILGRGLYVGLNGIMTFTRDEKQLEAAKSVPLNRLLLETDAPFLTPKPYRGKTCEPKHVRNTAEFLAGLRNEPLEQLAEATTKNAAALFNLA